MRQSGLWFVKTEDTDTLFLSTMSPGITWTSPTFLFPPSGLWPPCLSVNATFLWEALTSRQGDWVLSGPIVPFWHLAVHSCSPKSNQLHTLKMKVHRASSLRNGSLRDTAGQSCVLISHSGHDSEWGSNSLPGRESSLPQPRGLFLLEWRWFVGFIADVPPFNWCHYLECNVKKDSEAEPGLGYKTRWLIIYACRGWEWRVISICAIYLPSFSSTRRL